MKSGREKLIEKMCWGVEVLGCFARRSLRGAEGGGEVGLMDARSLSLPKGPGWCFEGR